MTKDEALELALEALTNAEYGDYDKKELNEAITAIKEALAQPVQEPLTDKQIWPTKLCVITLDKTAVLALYQKKAEE